MVGLYSELRSFQYQAPDYLNKKGCFRCHRTTIELDAGHAGLTHYCIVRKDLPLGVLAAQLIHAAGESAALWSADHAMRLANKADPSKDKLRDAFAVLAESTSERNRLSLPANTFAVCLSARDEDQLLELEANLLSVGIPHIAIREPDTPWLGQLMSIGIQPMSRERLRKLLSKYPLLKG